MSTEETLRVLLEDHFGSAPEKVTLHASLIDDLGLDSLDWVELQMALEEQFNINVDDEKASAWLTVGDVVSYVNVALAD